MMWLRRPSGKSAHGSRGQSRLRLDHRSRPAVVTPFHKAMPINRRRNTTRLRTVTLPELVTGAIFPIFHLYSAFYLVSPCSALLLLKRQLCSPSLPALSHPYTFTGSLSNPTSCTPPDDQTSDLFKHSPAARRQTGAQISIH